jgi:branched-chain amino acid transport system permease protein
MTVIGGPYSFLGPALGAFTYEYFRWFIRQFPLLETYWQFSFGLLLLIVVLYFDNGVAGGVIRFRDWLGRARVRYREDGLSGVVAFVWETVRYYLGLARDAVVAAVRSVLSRLRGLLGRLIPG